MTNQQLIDQLIAETILIEKAVTELSSIDKEILAAQPRPGRWSVLECIEHMNVSTAHYLDQLEIKLDGAANSIDMTFKSGSLANLFVGMMKPRSDGSIPYKIRTSARFQPEVDVKYDTITKFIKDQKRLVEIMKDSVELDLSRNFIPTPFGRIISFRLGDVFRFVTAHNQRHIVQMQQAYNEANQVMV